MLNESDLQGPKRTNNNNKCYVSSFIYIYIYIYIHVIKTTHRQSYNSLFNVLEKITLNIFEAKLFPNSKNILYFQM